MTQHESTEAQGTEADQPPAGPLTERQQSASDGGDANSLGVAAPRSPSWRQHWSRMPIRFKLWLLMLPIQLLGLTITPYWMWHDYATAKGRTYEIRALYEANRLTRGEPTLGDDRRVREFGPQVEGKVSAPKRRSGVDEFIADLGVSQPVTVTLQVDYRSEAVAVANPPAIASTEGFGLSDLNAAFSTPVRSTAGWDKFAHQDETAIDQTWRQMVEIRDPDEQLSEDEIRRFQASQPIFNEGDSPGSVSSLKQWAKREPDQLQILTTLDYFGPKRVIATILTVPLRPLNEELQRAKLWTAVIVLISIACLMPAIHLAVGIPVVGPVQELARRMRQAAPDTLASLQIPLTRHDEIGDLQQAFNVLASEIAAKQSELRQQQKSLELRVIERTAELAGRNAELSYANAALVEAQSALEGVNAELAKSNEELDAFAYTVAHDLQAPLRNVNFLVKEEIPSLVQRQEGLEAQELLKMASQLCEFNIKMVQELLSWARISREEPRIVPVDLNRTVEEVKVGLRAQLEERRATVQVVNLLPTVLCDRIPLHRVLTNLVTNGIKYNDRPDKRIEIGSQMIEGVGLAIYVRDNGIGIEPRNMHKLFTLLAQLHKPERFGKGIGMGLAIVKRTLEAYNGKIWAESTCGTGTTFWITLPLANS